MIGSRTYTVYLFLDSFELADDLLKSRQFFLSRPGITFEFWVTQVSDAGSRTLSNSAGAMTVERRPNVFVNWIVVKVQR